MSASASPGRSIASPSPPSATSGCSTSSPSLSPRTASPCPPVRCSRPSTSRTAAGLLTTSQVQSGNPIGVFTPQPSQPWSTNAGSIAGSTYAAYRVLNGALSMQPGRLRHSLARLRCGRRRRDPPGGRAQDLDGQGAGQRRHPQRRDRAHRIRLRTLRRRWHNHALHALGRSVPRHQTHPVDGQLQSVHLQHADLERHRPRLASLPRRRRPCPLRRQRLRRPDHPRRHRPGRDGRLAGHRGGQRPAHLALRRRPLRPLLRHYAALPTASPDTTSARARVPPSSRPSSTARRSAPPTRSSPATPTPSASGCTFSGDAARAPDLLRPRRWRHPGLRRRTRQLADEACLRPAGPRQRLQHARHRPLRRRIRQLARDLHLRCHRLGRTHRLHGLLLRHPNRLRLGRQHAARRRNPDAPHRSRRRRRRL